MRVALVGNVAQNAYLLALLLRRLDPTIEADSFDQGGGNPMWLPYWELASFDVETSGIYADHFDWQDFAERHEVARPGWAKILGADGAAPWYDTQAAFQADLARFYGAARHCTLPGEHPDARRAALRDLLAVGRIPAEAVEGSAVDLADYPAPRVILDLARRYDLTVLLGPSAAYGVLFPPDLPYVTFEHSTMRHAPQRDSNERRLLSLAYRYADANILTNADCQEAAWCLGLDGPDLDRRAWLPHPVDTDRFTPLRGDAGRDAAADQRRAILAAGGEGTRDCELIFWQPSRQAAPSAAGGKRNDRVLHAFRRYLDEAEPQGAPRAALLLSYWGTETKDTTGLMEKLGLKATERVLWAACASKPRMVSLYHAVDVVLDQFDWSVGSFGTTTVEALACGKPVVTHLDHGVHEWCLRTGELGSLPPIIQARTAEEIYRRMVQLATLPGLRQDYGRLGPQWVEDEHDWRRVAGRYRDLFARVLARRRSRAPVVAPEPEREVVAA